MDIGTVYKIILDKNVLFHGLSVDNKQLDVILNCK